MGKKTQYTPEYIPRRFFSIKSGEYGYMHIPYSYKKRFKGDIRCGELTVDGSLYGTGNVHADVVNISGSFRMGEGTLTAKQIKCKGFFLCSAVNAENVEISGVCNIKKLNAVTVVNKKSPVGLFLKNYNKIFNGKKYEQDISVINKVHCSEIYAEELESEEIYSDKAVLANGSIVKKVVCGELILKKGCEVGQAKTNNPRSADNPISEIFDMYEKGIINKNEAEDML